MLGSCKSWKLQNNTQSISSPSHLQKWEENTTIPSVLTLNTKRSSSFQSFTHDLVNDGNESDLWTSPNSGHAHNWFEWSHNFSCHVNLNAHTGTHRQSSLPSSFYCRQPSEDSAIWVALVALSLRFNVVQFMGLLFFCVFSLPLILKSMPCLSY